MTQGQKQELQNLNHKWRKVGLNKAELKRKQKLEEQQASEVANLASQLSRHFYKFDTRA